MSAFDRYLTIWVAQCIIAGVALGHLLPGVFQAIGSLEVAQVSLPVPTRVRKRAGVCIVTVVVWGSEAWGMVRGVIRGDDMKSGSNLR